MNLLDLGKEIARLGAPLLGHVIGGNAGEAIGQIVASQFGGDINDPQDLITKIRQDAESYLKLSQIQATQQENLQRLAVLQAENALKYSNKNTANARSSNLQSKTYFPQVLSMVIVIGFLVCIYWIAAYKQDDVDYDVLYMLLGVIGTSFGAVVNYWLGSSAEKGIQYANNVK
jgi:hypothetical protein